MRGREKVLHGAGFIYHYRSLDQCAVATTAVMRKLSSPMVSQQVKVWGFGIIQRFVWSLGLSSIMQLSVVATNNR
jgi:hypothetical protein